MAHILTETVLSSLPKGDRHKQAVIQYWISGCEQKQQNCSYNSCYV